MKKKIVNEISSIVYDAFSRKVNGDTKAILYLAHSLDKIDQIGIDEEMLDQSVLNGEVISIFWEYGMYGHKIIILCRPDGYPPLHMVLCISDKKVFIDTVYIVDGRFETDSKTRKRTRKKNR